MTRIAWRRGWSALAALACCGLAPAACSTSATITKVDGSLIEARILGADATSIRILSAGGVEQTLARSDVLDIDHPGNAAGLVGTIGGGFMLVGLGASIAVMAANCEGGRFCDLGRFMTVSYSLCLAGLLPPAIWGWVTWSRSRAAARAEPAPAAWWLGPRLDAGPDGGGLGLELGARW